jgi:hypothetical protein
MSAALLVHDYLFSLLPWRLASWHTLGPYLESLRDKVPVVHDKLFHGCPGDWHHGTPYALP